MIGYVTLGTNDLTRAASFYDPLLAVLGVKRMMENDKSVHWGRPGASFGVTKPFDGKPATVGNGAMVAFAAGSRESVSALHRKAIELGGRDEGAPGQRGEGFYAAYCRDPDGNKINFFFMG